MTTSQLKSTEKTQAIAWQFVLETIQKIEEEKFDISCVWNADQSGFLLEMHHGRTLAPSGSKNVEAVVQSRQAISHSYTILPIIACSGRLLSPLFLCIQEPGGKFPQKGHIQAENIVATANSSHIMSKAIMIKWVQSVLIPLVLRQKSKVLLLVDAWKPWTDKATIEECWEPFLEGKSEITPREKLEMRQIPDGTTSFVQPCDTYLFR